jgi:murein DD-endopeptidase MepM/ murein hydrolase activator NlpD
LSRHAAARRDRPSPGAASPVDPRFPVKHAARPTLTANTAISAADLVARHRRQEAPAESTTLAPRALTAAELIARHRAAQAAGPVRIAQPVARSASTGRPASTTPTRGRRRAQPTRRVLPAFSGSLPIKVVARPVIVVAAVIATVAASEAVHVDHSKAVSAEPAPPVTSNAAAPTTGTSSATSTSGTSTTGSSTATTGSSTSSPSATITSRPDRVSRSARILDRTPKVLTKPGQTVPGVWVKPNTGPMTSCFCMRWGEMHWGIDLAGPLGSPILAVGDGVVLQAGPQEGFGNWVVIQHSNGDVSIYGHMRYYFVHAGEKVKAGQKIALVGSEGQSTGPHLHFEVHKGGLNGTKIDPVPWLKARGIDVGPYDPNG